ncbi:MAG: LemA family protein [Burkholderiaceae bacterium]
MGTFIAIGISALALVWAVVTYNRFIASRNQFQNAFAQIDVQLKRRYDLIPNLVSATKGYLKHERETLEAVIAARSLAIDAEKTASNDPADAGAMSLLDSAEEVLTKSLGKLLAVSEAYPELKADQSVARLTEELTSTENRITFARQAFNDQVMVYNTEVESFPASLIASVGGFGRATQLRAIQNEAEREPVAVSL